MRELSPEQSIELEAQKALVLDHLQSLLGPAKGFIIVCAVPCNDEVKITSAGVGILSTRAIEYFLRDAHALAQKLIDSEKICPFEHQKQETVQ